MEAALDAPSLYDEAIAQLAKAGFAIPQDVLKRPRRARYEASEAVEAAWIGVYRDTQRHWPLYQLAEKLLDLDDALLTWRHKHVLTVERIIGMQARHRRHRRRRLSAADVAAARVPGNLVDADKAMKSYKRLFSRALAAAPGRLHFAAHSHHLWPDASYEGHMAAWDDGVRLADRKWEKVFGEVMPAAQAHIARELRLPDPSTIAFAPNTHELVVRLFSARQSRPPLDVLTSDGEFHAFRRQAARWEEQGHGAPAHRAVRTVRDLHRALSCRHGARRRRTSLLSAT